MKSARSEDLTRSPATFILTRKYTRPHRQSGGRGCAEGEHDGLLDDLEHDALADPDIARILDRARHILEQPAAAVPWWAR